MPYAVEADVVNLYGQQQVTLLADRNGDGVEDPGVVTDALTDASATVDSYLATRYQLPLANVPPNLNRICIDIAMYMMAVTGDVLTDVLRTRYEDAISWLTNVSKGVTALGTPQTEQSLAGGPQIASQPRVFGRFVGGRQG